MNRKTFIALCLLFLFIILVLLGWSFAQALQTEKKGLPQNDKNAEICSAAWGIEKGHLS